MKFRPLHDRVVVSGLKKKPKQPAASLFPTPQRRSHSKARSIAVGPGARDESGKVNALEVKIGDRVLFGKWSGSEVKIDGEELLIMKESDILGILEGKASVKAAA